MFSDALRTRDDRRGLLIDEMCPSELADGDLDGTSDSPKYSFKYVNDSIQLFTR